MNRPKCTNQSQRKLPKIFPIGQYTTNTKTTIKCELPRKGTVVHIDKYTIYNCGAISDLRVIKYMFTLNYSMLESQAQAFQTVLYFHAIALPSRRHLGF